VTVPSTFTLYVASAVSVAPGVSVAIVFAALNVGDVVVNAMHVAKLSAETCTAPVHAPATFCAVTVAGRIAWLNVTASHRRRAHPDEAGRTD